MNNKILWKEIINNPECKNFNHCKNINLADLLVNKDDCPIMRSYNMNPGFVYHIPNVLSEEEVNNIISITEQYQFYPVGEDGNAGKYQQGDKISSYRISSYDILFSERIFNRIKNLLPEFEIFKKNDFCIQHNEKERKIVKDFYEYEIIGLNPYNRIINYDKNGVLKNHYDGHGYFKDGFQTLMTCLMYLTDNDSGRTLFFKDSQQHIPIEKRIINVNDQEIILEIKPKKGDILFFHQHLLHATSILKNEEKKLILSDLIGKFI